MGGSRSFLIILVREAYKELAQRNNNSSSNQPLSESFTCIWKEWAILKAKVTAWRLMWNRLPTKDNVGKRILI